VKRPKHQGPLQGRGHAPGGFGQGLRLGTQKEIHQAILDHGPVQLLHLGGVSFIVKDSQSELDGIAAMVLETVGGEGILVGPGDHQLQGLFDELRL